jgi:adenosylmethionine-8-amino-7-oxononanoate aminotransferase
MSTARSARERDTVLTQHADAIAFCPPLILTEQQVEEMVACFTRTLDAAAAQLGRAS